MLAVIYSNIDESIQDILKENIIKKYPSISFVELDRAGIVADSPPETIILVMNEEILSDGYIKIVKGAYPNLEHLICLVGPEKYEDYYQRYSSYCKVLNMNKKDIRVWFDGIVGEPQSLKKKSSDTLISNIDLGLDDLNFEEEEIEAPSLPEIEDLNTEIDGMDEPNLDDLLDNAGIDLKFEENPILDIEKDISEDPLSELEDALDIEVHESGIEIKNDDFSPSLEEELMVDEIETVEELPFTEETISVDEEPPIEVERRQEPPIISEMERQKQKYEEKIISLRDGIDIPVWKKRQIKSKTIGIWSPLQRIGVTTLTMNLALYLASLSIPVAVLEGITKNIKMKSLLDIYSNPRKKWVSYNSYLEEEHHAVKDAVWSYRNVNFFPFEEHDIATKWNEQKIYYFVNGLKFHDLVFIDFPTGEMAPYTLESLKYIDELWIVVNNDLLSMMEWKEYIHKIVKSNVNVYGMFIDEFSFSKPKKIGDQLDLSIISSIPALHEEVARNYYESIPLLEHEGIINKVENNLLLVMEHLTGEKVKKPPLKDNQEEGLFNRFAKKIRGW